MRMLHAGTTNSRGAARVAVACALLLSATAAPAAPGGLVLRDRVRVDAAQIRVADVVASAPDAAPSSRRLMTEVMWSSPPPCSTVRIGKTVVAARLRQLRLGNVDPSAGSAEPELVVERGCQHLAATQLRDTAHAALAEWLQARSARIELAALDASPALALPVGHISLAARALPAGQRIDPRMQVWVDIFVDGVFARAEPVPFAVHAYRQGWVASRDARPGQTLADAGLQQQDVDLSLLHAPTLDALPEGGRLRRPLLAGEALTAAHVESGLDVHSGSAITLRSQIGGVAVEARAEALQDGRQGQVVWVKASTSTAAVRARVVGAGIVEVEGE